MGDSAPHKALRLIGTGLVILLPVVLALWFAQLRASAHPQARFLWAIFRDVFHYCAFHLAGIADNARDLVPCSTATPRRLPLGTALPT